MIGMTRRLRAAVLLIVLAGLILAASVPAAADPLARLNCTFTVKYPIINVRGGPGLSYDRVGSLRRGETFAVIDQARGADGLVWWQGAGDQWVRSDLGTSDCPATCGNAVCEYGETAATCAGDCSTGAASTGGNLTSTGAGCLVGNCQACYESVSCYPACSDCTCSRNEFGCVTCYCRYPGSTTSGAATATSTGGCLTPDCQSCYESISCYPACSQCTCSENEHGCKTCYCSYPSGQ